MLVVQMSEDDEKDVRCPHELQPYLLEAVGLNARTTTCIALSANDIRARLLVLPLATLESLWHESLDGSRRFELKAPIKRNLYVCSFNHDWGHGALIPRVRVDEQRLGYSFDT